MSKAIFYDPQQARWRRIRRIFDVAALLVSLLIIFFIYTALRSETLPQLALPVEKRPYRALKDKEKLRDRRRQAAAHRGHRNTRTAASQVKLNSAEGIRAAFYAPWDPGSFSSLREYAHQIDILFPDWLHVLTADGHLSGVDPDDNSRFEVVTPSGIRPPDDRVMPFLKVEDIPMEVFPLVNNFDGNDWVPGIGDFLNDAGARARFESPT